MIAHTRKGLTDEIVIARPKVTQLRYDIKLEDVSGYDTVGGLDQRDVTNLMNLIEQQRWLGYDHTVMAIDGALNNAGGVYNRHDRVSLPAM